MLPPQQRPPRSRSTATDFFGTVQLVAGDHGRGAWPRGRVGGSSQVEAIFLGGRINLEKIFNLETIYTVIQYIYIYPHCICLPKNSLIDFCSTNTEENDECWFLCNLRRWKCINWMWFKMISSSRFIFVPWVNARKFRSGNQELEKRGHGSFLDHVIIIAYHFGLSSI